MAIRTPDQRLRVFVSSTLDELADERRAVREAVESLRMTPVMFELGARPHPPRALYRAYLAQSDIFVGLYWQRYGWIAPGEKVSGLEDEYNLAGRRPKLIYIKAPAPNREPKLKTLIARIKAYDTLSYRRFADAGDLRSLVADDLAVLLTERFESSADPPDDQALRPAALGRVPRPLTRLIGREEDVKQVLALLHDPANRMVTLFGTGGIGKTRLALEVAQRAKDRYPHGVIYVELAGVAEAPLVIPTIAEALGMAGGSGADLGAKLSDATPDLHLLIVLDNMEHLTEAAPELAGLLGAAPGIQLLVTSRRLLNVRGEHVFQVEPLGVPGAKDESTPAVELFLDRAVSSRPDLKPTRDDLAAIAELTRRLDGLPLAIELASAWVRTLSPRAILAQMGDRPLELLRTGARDMPTRQRTLRDTIAWSYSLLAADAQTLFARFAVFANTASVDAIDHVANPDGRLATLDILASLVDTSLIRAAGDAATPRFGMLETIREFASDQLEATGQADEVRARYESYYLDLAERGSGGSATVDRDDWVDGFGNFHAVLRGAVRRGDSATGVRMGRALAAFWHERGWYSEGRDWMQDVSAWSTLELWALAELKQGRPEHSARLFALASRGYGQTNPTSVSTETETHRQVETELRAALGDRYEPLMTKARRLDFDAAMEQLATETPTG